MTNDTASTATDLPDAETLTERAYRELRQAISQGRFPPGQKVTSRAMAAELNISTTPAREALMRLVSEHILEMAGPKTLIVPIMSVERYREIITIRLALEGMACEAAALRTTDELIDQLETLHTAFVIARSNREYLTALEMNEQFHFAIYSRSGMPRLVSIIENLWASCGPSLRLLYPNFAHRSDGAQHHANAIAALRARDPIGTRTAIELDIQIGTSKILSVLHEQARATAS
jgi:DNA-binding GntR family transcriptional regulator